MKITEIFGFVTKKSRSPHPAFRTGPEKSLKNFRRGTQKNSAGDKQKIDDFVLLG